MPRDSFAPTNSSRELSELQVRTALALGHAEDALAAIGSLGPERRRDAGVRATQAELLLASSRPEEAEELTSRALRRCDCPEAAARLRIVRALARWELGGRVSRAGLERICAGSVSARARAAGYEALARMDRHRLELQSAERSLQQAWGLHVTDASAEGMMRVLGARAELERERGRTLEALRLHERCLALCRATTRIDLHASAHCAHAESLVSAGDWGSARAAVEKGRSLGQLVAGSVGSVRGSALVALAEGDLDAARASITTARAGGRSPRLLAEACLVASDLALVLGDATQAAGEAEEAIRFFQSVADESGVRRGWFRRSQALIALGRHDGALESAARAAAGLPVGSPTRVLASLARGRALLRLNRDAEAREVFAAVCDGAVQGEGEVVWGALAQLGLALAEGGRHADSKVRGAVRAVESWGDRRMLSLCLGELRQRFGEPVESHPEPVSVAAASESELLVRAIEILGDEGSWPERCAAALRHAARDVPWELAAWIGERTWTVARGVDQVRNVASDGLALCLAEPGVHDLLASPSLRRHPERVLLSLAEALSVRTGAGTLVVARGVDQPPWSAAQRGLLSQLARVLGSGDSMGEPSQPRASVAFSRALDAIVGDCLAMKELKAALQRIAATDVTVRIIGETGTGKELVARAVHELSPRAERAFVPFNSAAVQDDLFESELFGHVRGAFTGAHADRMGRVQAADGGTLFFDEVAELSPRGQAKLLRFLESGEYVRVGESQLRHADARIVVATNVDLERRVAEGRFREDLLHRMSDPEVRLPPLRERGEDLLMLARHYLAESAAGSGRPRHRLSSSVAQLLCGYRWPGNVRQLRSTLLSAVALAGPDALEVSHFPARLGEAASKGSLRRELTASRERELIRDALRATGGNCTKAAAMLGVTRQWFHRMRVRAGVVAG